MDSEVKDDRFSHLTNDPRFKRIPKARRKVKIDSRFRSMFKDDKFKYNYSVDKRGRPLKNSTTEDLKRFYALSSDENSSDSEDDNENPSNNEDENHEPGRYVRAPKSDSESETIPDAIKKKLTNLNVDYARGEANLQSDSSSDDESSEESASETDSGVEHNWGELDKDAESTNEATHRLAVCNMDWDRIRAIDLMVLLNSFLPSGGLIHSISIYPSEYGLKRMQEEETHGPSELVNQKQVDENLVDDDEMGANYHVEKLRQYQLNRLKYYYAIVECDTVQTADTLYKECDGLEYESSATKLDLRFVPDDTVFDHEPKETCSQMPDINKYQPRYFTTTALQQAKVELTWDETNHERKEITQKLASGKIDDITDDILHEYLASSSENESDTDADETDKDTHSKISKSDTETIDKYKQLLEECNKNEETKNNKEFEMEISWGVNLQKKTDEVMQHKKNDKNQLTPFEKYLEKRKEKRKEKRVRKHQAHNSDDDDLQSNSDDDLIDNSRNKRKLKLNVEQSEQNDTNLAELELLVMDENKEKMNLEKTQLKNIDKKRKKSKDLKHSNDNFELNVNDKRFAALYNNHHFNIDPTDPHFRKTDGVKTLIDEKFKRKCLDANDSIVNVKKRRKN